MRKFNDLKFDDVRQEILDALKAINDENGIRGNFILLEGFINLPLSNYGSASMQDILGASFSIKSNVPILITLCKSTFIPRFYPITFVLKDVDLT